MKEENAMVLGGFISDDFYFYFTREGIDALKSSQKIQGLFFQPDNKSSRKLKMILFVEVIKNKNKYRGTNIDVSFEKKECVFQINEDDFFKWFVSPSKWILENGPNLRDASSNVYIRTPNSASKYSHLKNTLISLINNEAE